MKDKPKGGKLICHSSSSRHLLEKQRSKRRSGSKELPGVDGSNRVKDSSAYTVIIEEVPKENWGKGGIPCQIFER